jgi:hypothetical protein
MLKSEKVVGCQSVARCFGAVQFVVLLLLLLLLLVMVL